MKYSIVVSSLQENSQSLKVGNYMAAVLKNYAETEAVNVLDLQQEVLPYWDNSLWKNDEKWNTSWQPKQKHILESDSLVLITPEYNGMATPSMKNFLLFVSAKEVGHKPVLITAVSAGEGGSYPINEMRLAGYKNTKLCYLPEHLIIRNAPNVLNSELSVENPKRDRYIRDRIDYTLRILEIYGQSFKNIRAHSNTLFNKKFPFGM